MPKQLKPSRAENPLALINLWLPCTGRSIPPSHDHHPAITVLQFWSTIVAEPSLYGAGTADVRASAWGCAPETVAVVPPGRSPLGARRQDTNTALYRVCPDTGLRVDQRSLSAGP